VTGFDDDADPIRLQQFLESFMQFEEVIIPKLCRFNEAPPDHFPDHYGVFAKKWTRAAEGAAKQIRNEEESAEAEDPSPPPGSPGVDEVGPEAQPAISVAEEFWKNVLESIRKNNGNTDG
jgi:hypothetical protein